MFLALIVLKPFDRRMIYPEFLLNFLTVILMKNTLIFTIPNIDVTLILTYFFFQADNSQLLIVLLRFLVIRSHHLLLIFHSEDLQLLIPNLQFLPSLYLHLLLIFFLFYLLDRFLLRYPQLYF